MSAVLATDRQGFLVSRKAQIYLTLVCILVGVMLVTQFRTQSKVAKSLELESAQDQATIITSLYESNSTLRREIARLSTQLEQGRTSFSQSQLDSMAEDLNQLRIITGLSEVTGPGVQLSISASLKAEDVMDLINELRNAGAEAIAVNGQRVIARSSFTNLEEGVLLDGTEIKPPYVFSAIGHSETLQRALERKGGLLAIVETGYPSSIITLEKRDKIEMPPYRPGYQWKHAQPAK